MFAVHSSWLKGGAPGCGADRSNATTPGLHSLREVVCGAKRSIIGTCCWAGASFFGLGVTVQAADLGAVGYVNITCRQNFQLIANPLSKGENRIDQVLSYLSPVPEQTELITFDGRTWLTNEFRDGAWTFPEMTLSPGGGALLRSPTNWIQTWTGSLLQGELKVLIPAGGSLRSCPAPLSGKLSEGLQFPRVSGTKIYRVDDATGQLELRASCLDARWEPEEPTLLVGESFYVEAPHEFIWSRAFVTLGDRDSPTNSAIRITTQPRSRQINPGDPLLLTVEAVSTNRLSYQWQLHGEDVPNATDPVLFIPHTALEHFGDYWVTVWDGRSWHWSDIAKVEPVGPRLTIRPDEQHRGVVLISHGSSGRNARIEVSTDLIQWTALDAAGPINSDSVLDRWTSQGARFYRLKLD